MSGLFGGGGGSSASTSNASTSTSNTDKRMVLDGASIGVSADGGSNVTVYKTVNSIDAGAVQAGANVALSALSSNSTNLDHLLATADHLLTQQQKSLDANVKLTGELAGTAQTAYADAAAQSSGNKNLILAGMAVVGIVAFTALKKG